MNEAQARSRPDVAPAVRIASVPELLAEASNGRMIALVDDAAEGRRACLMLPAQMVTPNAVTFMASHARGLICVALEARRIRQLGVPMLPDSDTRPHPDNVGGSRPQHAVSIEARDGVSTGISAADRARTIAVAIDEAKGPQDVTTPGHIFPLIGKEGGVLTRAGGTEAAIDIARLAGLHASGVICDILRDDGDNAGLADLADFADRHGIKVGAISDLVRYRLRHDRYVRCKDATSISDRCGADWRVQSYEDPVQAEEHLLLIRGDLGARSETAVHIHRVDFFRDLLGGHSGRDGIDRAMRAIAQLPAGIIVVLGGTRPNALSDGDATPPPLDARQYGVLAQLLADAGVATIRLLTDDDGHAAGLRKFGLGIAGT